jgi:hypothetical protein
VHPSPAKQVGANGAAGMQHEKKMIGRPPPAVIDEAEFYTD